MMCVITLAQGKASLASLRKQGYTYAQVAQAISNAEKNGLLNFVNNKLVVTSAGKEYIERLSKRYGQGGSGNWIVPQAQYYYEPVNRYSVIFKKKSS